MESEILERARGLLGPYADNPWLRALAIVVAALLAAKLADLIITRVLVVWARRSQTDLDDRIIALLHRPVFASVLLIGLWLAVRGLPLGDVPRGVTLSLLQTLAILVWLGLLLRLTPILIETLSKLKRHFSFIEPRTVALFDSVTRIVLVGGAVYGVFLVWGIDVGGILVAGGVLGIALGLAAKDSLANLFSGLFILADAPYKVGDFVNLDSGERGQVTQIGLRSTRLLTRDDIEITVPNAVIGNAKIMNETGGPHIKRRVRVKVGVAYGSDVDRVRELLEGVARDNDKVAEEPAPRVRFRAFGDSSLDFELLAWVEEPVLRGQALDSLNTEIYKALNAAGIEIPYPKRDVYVKESPPS